MASYDVKLPDIGEGVAEGEVVRWLVKPGDAVNEDQPLVEVMTDKASVEIPSPRTGTIASIHVEEGAVVAVGTVLVSIAVAGGAAGSASAPAAAHAVAGGSVVAASAPAATMAAGAGPAATTGPAAAATAKPSARGTAVPEAPQASNETRTPLRGLRRKIAEHMRRSLSTAAQFTFVAECDFTGLVEHRAQHAAAAERTGAKLTYLAYVFRALPPVLREFPLLNSSLDDAAGEIVMKKRFHLGLATATDEGLTVPILHDADKLGLFALAREIDRLAKAAREHKLKLEELQGGTFTVTSTGAKGGVLATPILHHPQVAILGVHAVTKKPAVVGDKIVARDLGNLSLSLDHRVVDGAVGADFLYALIDKLQSPAAWLDEDDLR